MSRSFALLLAAACSLVAVPTAAAREGGGGGGGSPSAPPVVDSCGQLTGAVYSDGTVADVFNEYGIIGGCVVIVSDGSLRATVYQVLPQPGWTYRLDIREQSDGSRVSVDYTESSTGRDTSLRVEPGRTVVRQ